MGYSPNHIRIKPKLKKQPEHCERVVGLGCVVCKQPAVPHHVNERGHGRETKDDRWIVGLCPIHHNMGDDSYHMLGSNTLFYQAHGIDLIREAAEQWAFSVTEGLDR